MAALLDNNKVWQNSLNTEFLSLWLLWFLLTDLLMALLKKRGYPLMWFSSFLLLLSGVSLSWILKFLWWYAVCIFQLILIFFNYDIMNLGLIIDPMIWGSFRQDFFVKSITFSTALPSFWDVQKSHICMLSCFYILVSFLLIDWLVSCDLILNLLIIFCMIKSVIQCPILLMFCSVLFFGFFFIVSVYLLNF